MWEYLSKKAAKKNNSLSDKSLGLFHSSPHQSHLENKFWPPIITYFPYDVQWNEILEVWTDNL